ncbi:hypothetical protein [Bacillus safensis]|uniref:hypothetical protein n=1 Tax=Bacillus TaxID=1386 RepID=UPI00226D251E|nr:hypothetical protein [Bacillus safensis]MCY1094248.1 hypothetical protein [Bacillus safensis]
MRGSQNIACRDAIERVINLLKDAINNENVILKANIQKNKEFIRELGWQPTHVYQELKELEVKNYAKGPENNQGMSGTKKGQIWIFGREIENYNVYIKLHLVPLEARKYKFICISFHEEEEGAQRLSFPHR